MRDLPDVRQQLDASFHVSSDLLFILDRDGVILDYRAGDLAQVIASPDGLVGRKLQDILPRRMVEKFNDAILHFYRTGELASFDYSIPMPFGVGWYETRLIPLTNAKCAVVIRDITKYKEAQVKIQRQVDQLAALRAIDLAITSSLDLNLTLSMFLNQVKKHLDVDAASILLLNFETQTLEYASGLGFVTSTLEHTKLRLGEGYAGLAALERRTIHVPNLRSRHTDSLRSPVFVEEAFTDSYAIPLIAKGRVLGVLEIFKRSGIASDPDVLEFMNMLAGQAAIAIESAILFDNFERSNVELTIAYDATIQGWSRALDLRDRDTEGHTQRVTEMTLRLARQVGILEKDLVHIRRGAMLHDMGKMAIPDVILLKPGPLNEEEWTIMRRHPVIAVDLLKPIYYLAPALEIPHYHHEKWDGSGYPNGLVGEQIPLSARLFALADVYDALISDRPYRQAWSKKSALEYIRDQSGIHFDPSLVPDFLKMVHTENS